MPEPRSESSSAALAGLEFGARDPNRLTRSDVDAAVLRAAGLGDLADRLWREGAAASAVARRSVTAHLRERFSARDPHSGVILRVVFVLLLLAVLPIGMLNGIRLGIENTVIPGAVVSIGVGIGVLIAVASAGARPLAILLTAAAGVAWAVTDGWVRVSYIGGAALAVVATIIVRIVRARSRTLTSDIDNGVELAHLDAASEVATERERMTADLRRELAGRSDLAALKQRRSAAITTSTRWVERWRRTSRTRLPGDTSSTSRRCSGFRRVSGARPPRPHAPILRATRPRPRLRSRGH